MRDISNYEQQYIAHPFERIQEKYRRRLLKKVISGYAKSGNNILEIGCGIKPLFIDYNDEYKFTVVEPAAHCYENACALAEKYKNVSCYKGFFEDVVNQIALHTGGGLTLSYAPACFTRWKIRICF